MKVRAQSTMADLSVLHQLPGAIRSKLLAKLLGLGLVLMAVVAMLAPWQQTVSGRGRVVAYAPMERRQRIDAAVSGRVLSWFVREGSWVEKGDPLVQIADNDPNFVEGLDAQRAAVQDKEDSYRASADSIRRQIDAARASIKSDVAASEAKVRVTREKLKSQQEKLKAADAALETAALNLGRMRALASQGLAATRDLELAELDTTKARTERDAAQADVLAAMGDLDGARASLDRARAEGEAKLQEIESKALSSESSAADARASLAGLDVNIRRQREQLVRAPRAGIVLQILAAEGGEQVKQGQPLALFVPDTRDAAAEIWVDGNDASLISEGRAVRLQFEGWPAVQFSGWPSVAVGTFGGRIAFVDPHDDGAGNFRAVILPDPDDEPWPPARFLRQGVRAKGWVLLEEVTVGFELWRRLNGFPPALEAPPGGPGQRKGGGTPAKP